MERRQKRRILIFLVFPFLIAIPFISDDFVIKLIGILLTVVYVALVIFLRDSHKKEPTYAPFVHEDIEHNQYQSNVFDIDQHESFEVVSKSSPIITDENFFRVHKKDKVLLKPPDLKERYDEIVNEEMPQGVGHNDQFSFVLEKLLSVIKESFEAHTAIFFWFNKRTEKLSIEKYASNSNNVSNQKFDIEDDTLSKIVTNGEPELLSDIPITAEADNIRYYSTLQGIRSFVGVPLFFDKNLVGVLAIDSKQEDQFGIETIYSLGRFVRIITILIGLFEQKYSEFIAQKRLSGLLNLISPGVRLEEEKDIISTVERAVNYLIPWDAFCLVYYSPIEKVFKTLRVINKTSLKYIGENLEVNLQGGTLVSKCIMTGIPVKIDDTADIEFKRFTPLEDVSFDGSFIAIPLIYQEKNFGVMCFESLKKNAYTKSDVDFLKSATGMLSFIIYSVSTHNVLRNYLALDVETKALNPKTFHNRLASDLLKSQLLKVSGAIALLKIDDFLEQETLFGGNPYSQVVLVIAEIISSELSPLNLFARMSERTFAVYFFNATSKDVYLWAEKLRVRIARQSIPIVAKQSTFTVSIGVASTTDKINSDEVLHNADLALQKALESGGNKVRNIN